MASPSRQSSQPPPRPSYFIEDIGSESEMEPIRVEAKPRQTDEERRTEEFMNELNNLAPFAEDDLLFNNSFEPFGDCSLGLGSLWPGTNTTGEKERAGSTSTPCPPTQGPANDLMGVGLGLDLAVSLPSLSSSFWENALQSPPPSVKKAVEKPKMTKNEFKVIMENGGGDHPKLGSRSSESVAGNGNTANPGVSGGQSSATDSPMTPNSSTENGANGFNLANGSRRLIEAHLKAMIDARLAELKVCMNSQFEKVLDKLQGIEKIQIQSLLTENACKRGCQCEEEDSKCNPNISEIVQEQLNEVKSEVASLKRMVSGEFHDVNYKIDNMGSEVENVLKDLKEAHQKVESDLAALKETVTQVNLRAEPAAETMIEGDSGVEGIEVEEAEFGGGLGRAAAETAENKNQNAVSTSFKDDSADMDYEASPSSAPVDVAVAATAAAATHQTVPEVANTAGHKKVVRRRKRGRSRKNSVRALSKSGSPPQKVKPGFKQKSVSKPENAEKNGRGRGKGLRADKSIALQAELLGMDANTLHPFTSMPALTRSSRNAAASAIPRKLLLPSVRQPSIGLTSTRNGKRKAAALD